MLISITLFFIAVFDFKHHRIPNIALVLLAIASLLEGGQAFDMEYLLLSSVAVGIFTFLAGCGLGDSKLLIVLLNMILPESQISNFILTLVLASSILISLHLIRFRSLQGEIAFAPAICGAVLALTP